MEPGFTKAVSLWLTDDQVLTVFLPFNQLKCSISRKVLRTRILVKFVAIPRKQLTTSWDVNWANGCKKGIVKKIVEIRNGAYDTPSSDTDSLSSSDQMCCDDCEDTDYENLLQIIPLIEEKTEGSIIFHNSSSKLKSEKVTTLKSCDKTSPFDDDHTVKHISEDDCMLVNFSTRSAASLAPDHESIVSSHSNGSHSQCDNIDTYSSPEHKNMESFQVRAQLLGGITMAATPTKPLDISELRPHCRGFDHIFWESSRVKRLKSPNSPTSFIIQVFGEAARDSVAGISLGLRACALLGGDKRIVGIDISNCPVTCLTSVVKRVCPEEKEVPSIEEANHHNQAISLLRRDIEDMIFARVGHDMNTSDFYRVNFFDRVKHFCCTNTSISLIQSRTINLFENLVTLDLSNNTIKSIEHDLELPSLVSLDLSGNQLSTLNHFQGLVNLRCLNVSANNISALEMSVHMIVPLAGRLISLDMSMNRVCDLPRYAEEVALLFPVLKYLDTVDLAFVTGETPLYHGFETSRQLEVASDNTVDINIASSDKSIDLRVIGDSAIEMSPSPPPISVMCRGASHIRNYTSRYLGYESSFLASSVDSPKKLFSDDKALQPQPRIRSPEPDHLQFDKAREGRFRRAFTRASRARLLQQHHRSRKLIDTNMLDDTYPNFRNPSFSVMMFAPPGLPQKARDQTSSVMTPNLPCEKNSGRSVDRSKLKTRSRSPVASKGYLKPTTSALVRYQSPLRENHTLAFRHRTDQAEAQWLRSQKKVFVKSQPTKKQRLACNVEKATRKVKTQKLAQSLESFISHRKNGVPLDADDASSLRLSSEAIPWDRNFGSSASVEKLDRRVAERRSDYKKAKNLSDSFETHSDVECERMEQRISKAVIEAILSSREKHEIRQYASERERNLHQARC